MYKIYNREELESRGILGVIDIIINQAYEEGNGEAFNNKYHPYKSPGETFVALWEGRPAGMISAEPSTYTNDPDIAIRACRLHVLKPYRTKQLGFHLYDHCYHYAKDNGYKVCYITHDVKSRAMNAIYQHKKKSLFAGSSRDPYELESWKNLEWNQEYLFQVDLKAEFYQNIYQTILEEGYHWIPTSNVIPKDAI
tara:strand:+ start:126 stop:710 length:585 start_codon:yes stop_codon:yes gene_type:complete